MQNFRSQACVLVSESELMPATAEPVAAQPDSATRSSSPCLLGKDAWHISLVICLDWHRWETKILRGTKVVFCIVPGVTLLPIKRSTDCIACRDSVAVFYQILRENWA